MEAVKKYPRLEQMIHSIRDDRSHGSQWLAKGALKILHDFTVINDSNKPDQLFEEFKEVCQILIQIRPNMAAISNSVSLMLLFALKMSKTRSVLEIRKTLRKEIIKSMRKMDIDLRKIKTIARKIIHSKIVFTHSYSSSIADVLRKSEVKRVIITESRPLCEGRALANELSESQTQITLITDASAGMFIPRANLVLMGADSILSDGSIVNKIGTFPIALISNKCGIPFYVLCDTLKFNINLSLKNFIPEESSPNEVAKDVGKNVIVENIYFDLTPSSLVTGVITEKGVLNPSQVRKVISRLKKVYSCK